METKKREKPCCAAEAMRSIRRIEVGDTVIGLAMLDDVLDDVIGLNLPDKPAICDELVKKIKIYNYLPKGAEPIYRDALFLEYKNRVK